MMHSEYQLPKLLVCLLVSACASASVQEVQELEARIHDGFAACSEGRHQVARQLLEPVLQSSVLPAGDPRRVLAAEVLAISDQALGDTATATRLHLSVLSDADPSTQQGQILILSAQHKLGDIRMLEGRWDEAASLLARALTLSRIVYGPNTPQTALVSLDFGVLLLAQQKPSQAVQLLEEALAALRPGPFGSDLLSAMAHLGEAYTALGRFGEAEPLLQEAVARGTQMRLDDPALGDALVGLAELWRRKGNDARAEPLLRKALDIYEHAGVLSPTRSAGALSALGFIRLNEGKQLAAEQYFRRALDRIRAVLGPDHLAVAMAEVNLAHVYVRSGDLSGARALLEHSAPIEKNTGYPSPYLATCLFVEAQWHAASEHTVEANQLFRESIAMFDATGWRKDRFTAEVLLAYARFLKPHRKKDAAALQRRANAIRSLRQ
jgi:tetratricopeptide (TPR) repeat protein